MIGRLVLLRELASRSEHAAALCQDRAGVRAELGERVEARIQHLRDDVGSPRVLAGGLLQAAHLGHVSHDDEHPLDQVGIVGDQFEFTSKNLRCPWAPAGRTR